MKTLKPYVAPQKSVKIKIQVNFYFNATFWNARVRALSLYDVAFLISTRRTDLEIPNIEKLFFYISLQDDARLTQAFLLRNHRQIWSLPLYVNLS